MALLFNSAALLPFLTHRNKQKQPATQASNISQMISKCGKNKTVADELQAIWNIFILYNKET